MTTYSLEQDTGLELGGPGLRTRAEDRTAANGRAGKNSTGQVGQQAGQGIDIWESEQAYYTLLFFFS